VAAQAAPSQQAKLVTRWNRACSKPLGTFLGFTKSEHINTITTSHGIGC
jgi:hypothetical protein